LTSGTSPNVLFDTSAVIDFEGLDGHAVAAPVPCDYTDLTPGIRAITLAELAVGPHATADPRAPLERTADLMAALPSKAPNDIKPSPATGIP
jgi:hypothetical protein